MDIGIHMTDLARYFLGEITTSMAACRSPSGMSTGRRTTPSPFSRTRKGSSRAIRRPGASGRATSRYVEVYGDNGMVRAAYAPMSNLLIANTTKGKVRKIPQILSGNHPA